MASTSRASDEKEIMLAGVSYFLACSLYNAYPLPQQMAGTRRALAYTGELINRAYCPIVFPEGLRTSDGKMQKFRPGIGMMVVRMQVPVVPIRLTGLYEIYSLHDSWPRRGPVSYEDVSHRLEQAIASMT
jgi:long-chain acyl-CoA synthetase